MMICSEEYINNIKNKNLKELEAEIKDLQKEITYLKAVLEIRQKGYIEEKDKKLGIDDFVLEYKEIAPSEDLQLEMNREYLNEAIILYETKGGKYNPTKQEIKDKKFNDNVKHICSFQLSYEGQRYCYWNHLYINIYNGKTIIDAEYFDYDKSDDPDYEEICKTHVLIGKEATPILNAFRKKLKMIHIGEWDSNYNPTDYAVLDGFSWHLKIIYNNKTKDFTSEGRNCYPFSFEELKSLIEFYATHETAELNELNDFMFLS